MGIRVTILMATGRFAWSETHWAKGGTTVEGVETDAKRLCKKRAACLAPNGYVVACRASNDALPNDAKLIDLSDMAPQNTLGIGGMPTKETGSFSDIQQTCLMVRINGAVGGRLHQGRILMAGIPDSVVQTNGAGNRIYVPNGDFSDPFKAYRAELMASWSFRVVAISNKTQVHNLVVDAALPNYLGTAAATGGDPLIKVGSKVRLRNFLALPGNPRLNGVYQVSAITPPAPGNTDSLTYLRGATGFNTEGYNPLGTIEGISYIYANYDEVYIAYATSRKRGGRTGLPRGRSLRRSNFRSA